MKGDVELVFIYKDFRSVSELVESLKNLSDESFLKKIYDASIDKSVCISVPFGNHKIFYNWGEDSLLVSFDW
jgi:hypothetical protein